MLVRRFLEREAGREARVVGLRILEREAFAGGAAGVDVEQFGGDVATLFAGLALATVVLSLGELIVFPTFSVEVDQLTPDDLRGSYFGAANLYSLGTALAPLYGGIMLDHAGSQALYLGLAALCGVIMLLQVGAVGLRQAERAGG